MNTQRPALRSFLFPSVLAALLAGPLAQAQTTRYWDGNDGAANFGSASGTWAAPTTGTATAGWTTDATGATAISGNSITTLINDPLHFGTDTAGRGLGTGTITVSGTVDAASLRFGSQTTGNVILSGGIINLGATATIHVGAGGSTFHTISSQITGAGTSLTKTGNTLQLSGANSFTGQTIISAGTLILNNANALGGSNLGVNGTSAISMANGTTLQSNFAPADVGNSLSFVYAPITLTGATANFLIGAGSSTAPAEAVTFNLNGAISGGASTGVVFGNTTASRNNADSIIVLGAASTYTGNTTIQAGNTANRINVRAGVENALPTTTVLTFDTVTGSGSGRTTQFDLNGNNQTLAGLSNGGIVPEVRNMTVTSATAATLTINNTANFTFGGRTISTTVATIGTNTRAQISGAISLVKNGTGTFTLGGTLAGGATPAGNSFTGSTKILGGILVLGETVSIQNSTFNTQESILGDATNGLRTAVTTLTLGGINGNKNFADVFTTTSGGYTGLTALTLNIATGDTRTYSADIGNGAGSMSLIKSGAGTQVLASTNTHSGGTTINNNGGILRITAAAALGSGAVSILTAGTNTGTLDLALTGTNTLTQNFTTNSASTLTTAGANAHILNTSGDNTISGNITVTSTGGNGTNIASNGGLLTLAGTITSTVSAGPRTLSLGGSGNGVVSGAINNDTVNGHALSVQKSGAGTWTLSNASNGFTGATTVAGGTLLINGSTAAVGLVTVSATATLGGTGSTGAVTVQNGGTLAPGNAIESLGVASVDFVDSSTFAFEFQTDLFAGSPNASADLVDATGALNITAGALLTLTDLGASTALTPGSKFTLVSYTGSAPLGVFTHGGSPLNDGDMRTIGANTWQFDYDDTTGGPNFTADQSGAGNYFTMTVVPEAGTAGLLGLGLLLLRRLRRGRAG